MNDVFLGKGVRGKSSVVRVEFSPATCRAEGLTFVRRVLVDASSAHVTRIDVAVDLPVPLPHLQILGSEIAKVTAVRGARLETIYVGARRSRRSVVAYDKKAQLWSRDKIVVPGDLTRIEARRKGDRMELNDIPRLENPFESLRMLWLDSADLPLVMRLLVTYAQHFGLPCVVKELPPKRRAALLRKLEARTRRVPVEHPRLAYERTWRDEATRVLALLGR